MKTNILILYVAILLGSCNSEKDTKAKDKTINTKTLPIIEYEPINKDTVFQDTIIKLTYNKV